MNKRDIFNLLLAREGGYVDHPNDRGGPTNFGITEAVARSCGYDGDMQDLPLSEAEHIYTVLYWDKVGADEIYLYSPDIAAEVFDTAVNCGVSRAAKILQRALNVLSGDGDYYSYLVCDGVAGSRTVEAVRKCINHSGADALLVVLNCLQGMHYIKLVERDPSQHVFIKGWINHRVKLQT